jgi:hypothetical protein
MTLRFSYCLSHEVLSGRSRCSGAARGANGLANGLALSDACITLANSAAAAVVTLQGTPHPGTTTKRFGSPHRI